MRNRAFRVGAIGVYWTATCFVAVELVLRLYGLTMDDRLAARLVARGQTMPPGMERNGGTANALGYWDEPFQVERQDDVLRVAALGDATAVLSGTPRTNCLNQLETRVADVEVYNFGLAAAGPQEYAAQLRYDVAPYRPDVVLSFVSVDSDLHESLALPGWFDWRGLRLVQHGLGEAAGARDADGRRGRPTASRQSYLRSAVRQTSVCRTPIPDKMRAQWETVFADLRDLTTQCRRRSMTLVLVVVPARFQFDEPLRAELCRRSGCPEGQLDVDLPQRKIIAFAAETDVAVIDLLPHFRASREMLYARNARHLSDSGNQITADVLCRWMQQHYSDEIGWDALADAQ